jgi:hypothetical protein
MQCGAGIALWLSIAVVAGGREAVGGSVELDDAGLAGGGVQVVPRVGVTENLYGVQPVCETADLGFRHWLYSFFCEGGLRVTRCLLLS